jgi:hypothetical protein
MSVRYALVALVCCAAPITPPPAEASGVFLTTPLAPAIAPSASPPPQWRAIPSQSKLFTIHLPDELKDAQVSDMQDGNMLVMQLSPRMILSFHVFAGQGDLQALASKKVQGTSQVDRTMAFGVPALLARGEAPCPKMVGGTDDCRLLRFEILYVAVGGNGFVFYSGADDRFPELRDLSAEVVDATTFGS